LRLAWVELRDLRNHVETRLDELPEGLITVAGPNGEGKTNLLEGIAFLFFLQSPRTSSTEPVVRRDADGPAYARGEILTEEAGKVLVEVEIPGRGANRVQVNRSTVRRKRDLRRQVRAVYFGPDDLVIVIGDPSKRREFLDDAIRSLWPLKESAMTAYERTLRQRNRLIKEWEGRGAPTGLEAWDAELVKNGSALRAGDEAGAVDDEVHSEVEYAATHEAVRDTRPDPAVVCLVHAFDDAILLAIPAIPQAFTNDLPPIPSVRGRRPAPHVEQALALLGRGGLQGIPLRSGPATLRPVERLELELAVDFPL